MSKSLYQDHRAKIICTVLKKLQYRMVMKNASIEPLFLANACQDHKIVAADLFCGAGGFSLAALRSGFQIAFSCENNPHACATYRANFSRYGHPHQLIEGDITQHDPAVLLRTVGLRRGDLDIIIGGPPCQGFSVHNPRNRESLDARNRLVLTYLSLVEYMRPRYFLIENVPGLLREGHRWVLATIRQRATEAGYIMEEPALLNARDYGVPQNRLRVFLLARRKGMPKLAEWPPAPTHFAPDSSEVAIGGRPAWRTARVVFDRPMEDNDPERRHMISGPVLSAVFASTPLDGGSRHQSDRVLSCHTAHDGHRDVYGRIDTSRPGPTMTTACINPSKGRFVHPWENHGISVRHAARFQSFPDDFVFSGGLIAAGQQVGNAVPPELGAAVLAPIAAALLASKANQSIRQRGVLRRTAA